MENQLYLFVKINDIFKKMQGIWQFMHSNSLLLHDIHTICAEKNTLSAAQGVLLEFFK